MFLDVVSVAKRYGICRNSIANWVKDGTMPPPVRFGKRGLLRWPMERLQAWEDAGCPRVRPQEKSKDEYSTIKGSD